MERRRPRLNLTALFTLSELVLIFIPSDTCVAQAGERFLAPSTSTTQTLHEPTTDRDGW
ncbi:protein of unknown function [Mesotoga infera]|uniref:Uncharacterized protein n=1 Tax=Mesotoga infera TaxID=1236046 RepID=A0A7Z7PRN1_9BACT|nr:protein of unknown function [Mesotoga infera]